MLIALVKSASKIFLGHLGVPPSMKVGGRQMFSNLLLAAVPSVICTIQQSTFNNPTTKVVQAAVVRKVLLFSFTHSFLLLGNACEMRKLRQTCPASIWDQRRLLPADVLLWEWEDSVYPREVGGIKPSRQGFVIKKRCSVSLGSLNLPRA